MRYEKSCGSIIFKDDKALVIEQKAGFYGFPKGHMEENETEEMTAIREIKEETNLDIKIDKKLRFEISYIVKNDIKKDVVYFVGYPLNDELKIQNEELKSARWIPLNEVKDILTFDNLKELWCKVLEEISKK